MTGRPSEEKRFNVYVLRCPTSKAVRYVGVTTEPERRLQRHISEARRRETHRHNWVCAVVEAGRKPIFEVIERDVEDWSEAERRWVTHYREQGCRLVNGNDGGACMKQAQGKAGSWPGYRFAMRSLGQNARWAIRNNKQALHDKLVLAQMKLRRAAAAAKRSGRMSLLNARLEASRFYHGT